MMDVAQDLFQSLLNLIPVCTFQPLITLGCQHMPKLLMLSSEHLLCFTQQCISYVGLRGHEVE